ncbi:hypothetical protein ACU5EH_00275 [Aliivibrio salmonicida]|uniref:hypothetical protein n=1 Tax=Aliivibrio salmonicida TaxID=40269 RepID=UPI00406D1F13
MSKLSIECYLDLYNASAVTINITPIMQIASELEAGIARVATIEQVQGGVNDNAIVTPKKLRDTQQFQLYNPSRQYNTGEVCFTIHAQTGGHLYWQWYSNVESLAGKNPLDEANRRSGWSDVTKPWYWSPFRGSRAGETVWWGGVELPEDVILDNGQLLPAAVYHRLAEARPDLVIGNNIRMQKAAGRFLRAASADYPVGTVHDDAIRNIIAKVEIGYNHREGFSNFEGAFTSGENTSSIAGNSNSPVGGDKRLIFDASLAVPTANENQPKGIMEWKGVAI